VRTGAGADAFSPGFCGGLAVNAIAASGCTSDDDGIDVGGRAGYDWQAGRFVFGGLVDVSKADVTDSVTAFSTTPAFYAFTRELNAVIGFRGRAGAGTRRLLVYCTAGGAWGNVSQIFTTSNRVNTFVSTGGGPVGERANESVWGYQAGGGVEVALGHRWSVTGEYLFTSLDNREASGVRSQGPAPATNAFILVSAAGTDFRARSASSSRAHARG
jgi:outer membrane immunogenic protein